MIWDEFQIGDVVTIDEDLLLVVRHDEEGLYLLGLDVLSGLNGTKTGGVEVWDKSNPMWNKVANNTKLVYRP